MIIYALLFMMVFLLSFKIQKEKYNLYDFLMIITLVIFSGIRSVGVDYHLYKRIYYSNFSLESRTGIGFNQIMNFVKNTLHLDYQYLIFGISLITIVCIYHYIKKKSKRPGTAVLVFLALGFYTTSFNMFRQSLSISLVLMGTLLFDKNKKVLSTIPFTIAFLVHSSSIIAIMGYMLMIFFGNKKKIKFRYIVLIALILLLLYDNFYLKTLSLLEGYSLYSTYDTVPGIGTILNVLLYLIFTILFVIPKYKVDNKDDGLVYNLFLIGVGIMILEFKNFLFFRIAMYFTILAPIILTKFYVEHGFTKRKMESLIFYISLFIYYMVYVYSFDGVLPYNVFWG